MKKYNLLKVLAITVLVTCLLALVIPGSYADYSGNITADKIASVGIFGLLSNMSISISYFSNIAVFLVAVACFYAVINKVDVYKKFVKNTALLFQNKKGLLVTISIIVFGLLALVVSDMMILIVFMPFIYQVMTELEIDKKVILSSTIVASLVGAMNGIYNSTLFGLLNLEVNSLLLVKAIMLVLSLAILIFFVAPRKVKEVVKTKKTSAKKTSTKTETKKKAVKTVKATKENKVNKIVYAVLTILFGCIGINKFYAKKIKAGILSIVFCWTLVPFILSIAEFITVLTEKADKDGKISVNSDRRCNVLFGTSLVLFVLFILSAIIPWESLFKTDIFTKFNVFLNGIKVAGYSVFNNIIGAPITYEEATGASSGVIAVLGNWALSDVSILLLILSAIVAITQNVKFDEFVESESAAIKKVLPIAITAMLVSIVLVLTVTTGINITITNAIVKIASKFNIVTTILSSIVGSVLVADSYYFVSTIGTVLVSAAANADYYGVVALIMQSIFYLTMIIAPTSVGLVIGLYFLDIPYGKWFKYIWKVLLSLLILVIIATLIVFILL